MKSSKKRLYSVHRPIVEMNKSAMRKSDKRFRKMTDRELTREAIRFGANITGHLNWLRTIDGALTGEEYFWLKNRRVIFPESEVIIDQLYKSKSSIHNLQALMGRVERFILAMPKGYEIDGYKIPSCFVSIYDVETQNQQELPELLNEIDISEPERQFIIEQAGYGMRDILATGNPADQWFLSISYIDEENQVVRTSVTFADLQQAMNVKTNEDFRKIITKYNTNDLDLDEFNPLALSMLGKNRVGTQETNDYDNAIQTRLIKIVAAMMIYTAADPNALREGFPSRYSKSNGEPDFGSLRRAETLSLHGKISHKASPTAHYRSFHFRQLMDDKYYRGEHEHKPKGSRVVFVREAYVGGKAKPETLI